MVPDAVLRALSRPVLGHLDPEFVRMMEELKRMLRDVFQTRNDMTFPVSGTGSAGMEFCFANLVEPGDEVIVCINGVFGVRMAEVAERCGARVTRVEAAWGRVIDPQQVADALKRVPHPKLVALVHAETSTGVLTPPEEISRLAHEGGALFLLDTVTSLGGCPVLLDAWQVDAVYSGTQKCLSCPPGLSPVSLSPRALEVATHRKTKVQSWYLDVNLLASYWGQDRVYHHTAPISMNYALHEAVRLALEEGLEARFARHQREHQHLRQGLEALGLQIVSQSGHQLWQLNAVGVPPGVDEAGLRKRLLQEFNIEVGAGLGPLKGKIIRIGLMGDTARPENVDRALSALRICLNG
jgi:alanine-glyoxylate transaminase/serine-glyoxylate transaminase/serine-pyruvate transaminase